jgi:hypothetical protein
VLTPAELTRYDANLVAHTQAINGKRKAKGRDRLEVFSVV